MLLAIRVWASEWADCAIVVKCANEAVVSVVNSGVTRDSAQTAMGQNIWFNTATHNIKFKLVYIPGVQNACADLSKWGSTSKM